MDDSYNPTDEQLRTWYKQTSYRVFNPELVLRIGYKNKALDELLGQYNFNTFAYLTAWNPQSQKASQKTNQENQARLTEEINQHGYKYHLGAGEADNGQWPPEPSLLILQISRENAITLGKKYNQKAIIFGRLRESPELLFIDY